MSPDSLAVQPAVGIIILPTRPWPIQRERWRRAEAYGFDHGWTYDHLGWDHLAAMPWGATIPTLIAAATVTERIPLGTWVASPNYRHPATFAYDLAALDDVSQGRAVLAIGAGGTGTDSRGLGQPLLTPAQRAARLEEFVGTLDAVLRRDVTTWRTNHYTTDGVRRPLRHPTPTPDRPRMPFVIAANGPRLMRLALGYGEGWATTGASRGDPPVDQEGWWQIVAEAVERFNDLSEQTGQQVARRMLSIDAGPVFSLTSIEAFREARARAGELGFTDVVAHWPEPGAARYDAQEDILEEIAASL